MDYPFQKPSYDQWIDQVTKDLKGRDLSELSKKIDLNLDIKAIYKTDSEALNINIPHSNEWKIAQTFTLNHTNEQVLNSLNRGVNDLYVPSIKAEELLKGVNPDFVSINLIGSSNLNFTQCVDPIAESLANGNSINILNKAPIISNSRTVQQSGGSIKNQLVYLFGSLAAQLSEVSENNINEALSSMKIFTAVSTDYLIEVSKLRAIRALWPAFCKGFGQSNVPSPFIYAVTSSLEYSLHDNKSNMLRATTQAMSAIIGGADSIEIHPYDYKESTNDDFGLRIAQNLHHVLKEEAHLDKVSDPAKGSYAIEALTSEIADTAWEEFLELENNGGLIDACTKGQFQNSVEKDAEFLIGAFEAQNKVLVGVNKYINQLENQVESNKTGRNINNVVKTLNEINLDNHIKTGGN